MKNRIIQRAINKEDKIIGNLKTQFIKHTLSGQRQVKISPSDAVGNISLAYYRGLACGREEGIKTAISILKKQYPEASKYLKQWRD